MEIQYLALIPALLAIILAIISKRPTLSLGIGLVVAGPIGYYLTGDISKLNILEWLILPSVASKNFANLLIGYILLFGGIVGIWTHTGTIERVSKLVIAKFARGKRSTICLSWLFGCLINQGAIVSTVMVGALTKPVARRNKLHPLSLSFIVDSTAAPVASLFPANSWFLYVMGILASSEIVCLANESTRYQVYLHSIFSNYYAWFAILLALLVPLFFTPRRHEEISSFEESIGNLNQNDTVSICTTIFFGFIIPILLIGVIPIVFLFLFGKPYLLEALCVGFAFAAGSALFTERSIENVSHAILRGAAQMAPAGIILAFALAMGLATKDLGIGQLFASIARETSTANLSIVIFSSCAIVSFLTGTSFGTMAIFMPIALAAADTGTCDLGLFSFYIGTVAAGSVFGDHASIVSDTTIFSARATGVDVGEHFNWQLWWAVGAAILSVLCYWLFA